MLKRQYRLTKSSAFTATYKLKNSYRKSGITLWVGKLKKEDYPTRAAFVVSKKTHKRAVKRNRIKRLMREAYRLILKNNYCPDSQQYISLIFVAHEEALEKSFSEIQEIILDLLLEIKSAC